MGAADAAANLLWEFSIAAKKEDKLTNIKNGNVILVNPNGVFLTKSGAIRSNSLTASSLDINTSDFLQSKYHFYKTNPSKI